jgi:hypothetical protein
VDAFSYLAVLLSIVLGLGLTQILTAVGRIIRQRGSIQFHWLPILWATILFVIYLQVWWAMYGFRLRSQWSFLSFAVVLAQTATLYLMAAVVLPEQIDDGTDLTIYFDRHHRWFFGLFLATLLVSVVKDLVISGEIPSVVNLVFHLLFAAGCLIGMLVRRWRAQEILGISFAALILSYIALLFARLR